MKPGSGVRLALALCLTAAATGCAAFPSLTQAKLSVDNAVVRAAPYAGAPIAAYVAVENRGRRSDRLVGVDCACAERVEIHGMDLSPEAPGMTVAQALDVPAGGALEIRPGSPLHLMLVGVKAPMTPGETVPMVLRFERSGTISVDFTAVEDTRAAWRRP